MRVAVLGAGRIGKAMALDLAMDSQFDFILRELDSRGVLFRHSSEELSE